MQSRFLCQNLNKFLFKFFGLFSEKGVTFFRKKAKFLRCCSISVQKINFAGPNQQNLFCWSRTSKIYFFAKKIEENALGVFCDLFPMKFKCVALEFHRRYLDEAKKKMFCEAKYFFLSALKKFGTKFFAVITPQRAAAR